MTLPRLNRRLVLEEATETPDGAGGVTRVWAERGVLWAAIAAAGGREREVGDLPVSQLSYRITVRAAPIGAPSRPTARQRFREGTRIFHIRTVQEAEPAGRYLICRADEELTV